MILRSLITKITLYQLTYDTIRSIEMARGVPLELTDRLVSFLTARMETCNSQSSSIHPHDSHTRFTCNICQQDARCLASAITPSMGFE